MKTLYESILSNTSDKVKDVKQIIPPTIKDWRQADAHNWVIDYNCKPIIDEYIDMIPNEVFDGTTNCNPFKIKKSDITTIRCIINTSRGNQRCSVELCADNTGDGDVGVDMVGLSAYLNGFSVSNAKKSVVEYFNRLFKDWDLMGRTFTQVKREAEALLKWGHCLDGKAIWNIR